MAATQLRQLQLKLEAEATAFRDIQKDINKAEAARQQCAHQFSENDMVIKELERLEPDAGVFKLVGPVLVRQDLVEARANVTKRLEYISGESERLAASLKALEAKMTEKQREIVDLQRKMQAVEAAAAPPPPAAA